MRKASAGRMMAVVAVIGLLAACATQLLTLEPSTAWSVDTPGNTCHLNREFGEGKQNIVMDLVRLYPGADLQMILRGDGVHGPSKTQPVSLRYGPSGKERQAFAFKGVYDDGQDNWYIFTASLLPPPMLRPTEQDELRVAQQIDTLELGQGFRRKLQLKLGPMEEPTREIQKCIDDLVTSWGLDPARQKTMTRPVLPASDPRRWMTYADYPVPSLPSRGTYSIYVIVTVDAQGKVTGCRSGAHSEEEKRAACAAVRQRASFMPALDKDGQPMPSYWADSLRFQRP